MHSANKPAKATPVRNDLKNYIHVFFHSAKEKCDFSFAYKIKHLQHMILAGLPLPARIL